MPIAQILQSLKGTCRFCRQQAGLLQRDHPECRRTHQAGWQEMVQLPTQTAKPQTLRTGDGWFAYNLAANLAQAQG